MAPQFKSIPYFLLKNKEHNLPVNNNLFSPSSSFSVSWVFSGRPSSWLVHPLWYLVLARLVHAQPGSARCGRDCSCMLEKQAVTSIHCLYSILLHVNDVIHVPICFLYFAWSIFERILVFFQHIKLLFFVFLLEKKKYIYTV